MGRILKIARKYGLKSTLMVSRDLVIVMKFYILDKNRLFPHGRSKRLINAVQYFNFQFQLNKILGLGFDFTNQNQAILESRLPLLRYLYLSTGKTPFGPFDEVYLSKRPDVVNFEKSLLVHCILYNTDYFNLFKDSFLEPKTKSSVYNVGIPEIVFENLPSNLKIIISTCHDFDINYDKINFLPPNHKISFHRIYHPKLSCSGKNFFDEASLSLNSLSISFDFHRYCVIDLKVLLSIISQINWHGIQNANTEVEFAKTLLKNNFDLAFNQSRYMGVLFPATTASATTFSEFWRSGQEELSLVQLEILKTLQTGNITEIPILIVSHEDRRSGAPIFAGEIAKSLKSAGFKPKIVVIDESGEDSIFNQTGIDFEYLSWRIKRNSPELKTHKSWLLTQNAKLALKSIIEDFKPRLVILNSLASSNAAGILSEMNIPYVSYVHENWGRKHSLIDALDPFLNAVKFALTNASAVFYGSQASMDVWSNQGEFRNEQVLTSILPLVQRKPISGEISHLIEDIEIYGSSVVFLGIAVFEPRKRIEDIICAFKAANISNSVLVLVGKAGRFPEYERKIQQLAEGVSNIHLMPVTNDVSMYLNIADIFVHASEEEVFPLIIQEALGHNLPVVVARYPGYDELVGKGYPYVFDPCNVQALTLLLKNYSEILKDGASYIREVKETLKKNYEINEETLVSNLRKFATTIVFEKRVS